MESNVFNYRFSTIEYDKLRPFLELPTNSIVLIVGDIFGNAKCRAKELELHLHELKYVKRITTKQAVLLSTDWLGTGENEDVDLKEQTEEDSEKEEEEEAEATLSETDEETSEEQFV